MNKAIKTLYERNGVTIESEQKPVQATVKKENLYQICGVCKEEKPIVAFGLTGDGHHKYLCTNCELERNQPRQQPRIVGKGKGKPVIKYPNEVKKPETSWRKKRTEKTVAKQITKKQPEQVEKVVKNIRENKPKVTKELLDLEAQQLFDDIIQKYLLINFDGFTNKQIVHFIDSRKDNRWVDAKLRRMVKLALLQKRKVDNKNIYFVKEIETGDAFDQLKKVEKAAGKGVEKVVEETVKDIKKAGKKAAIEEERKQILDDHRAPVTTKFAENSKAIAKVFAENIRNEPINFVIPEEEDFIKRISVVADSMLIDFTEKTTTITVSPTNNILRAYDLLTDEQKLTAEILYKNAEKVLKFKW